MNTTPSPRQVWDRLIQAGMRRDITAQADLYAEDGVLEFPFLPAGTPHRFEGRAAIEATLAALQTRLDETIQPDPAASTLTVHESTDPKTLIAEIGLAIGPPESRRIMRYVQIVHVEDGKIHRMRDYFGADQVDFVTRALNRA